MRFLLGALMLLALPVHAYFGLIQPWLQSEIRTGYVMTRAQVVSPEGNLFLIVEESSNTSGNPVTREVRLVGEVEIGGDLDGFYVLSAADIRYYQNWYKQLRAERGENLMDRAEWLDRDQLAQGVKLANGTVVTDLRLADVTKKVLVLGERDRFGSNPDGWLLMQVPYDPDQVSDLEDNVTSLLFDRDGNLLDQTTGSRNGDTYTVQTFAYRTAYYGQGEDAVEQSDRWAPSANDRIFGPMTSQTVRLYEPSMPVSTTNERGMYSLFWIMPCPFGGVLDFSLELELQARSYNPMGSSMLPLLMHHQTSAACSQTSSFFQGPNFYVDLIWMAGQVRFANELNGTPLPIGEELLFDASVPELTRAEYAFDFDGDGTADTVVQANKKVEDELDPETNEPTGRQFIVPDTEGDPSNYQWQAVYFSSGTRDPNAEGPAERQPDLWRVADRNLARDANNELLQAGRLTQISTEAALNTDVYIFRESTGELIVEVSGLPEAGDRRIVDNGRAYTWNTVMRGPRSQMFIGGAVTLGSTYSNQKDPQKFAEDLGISSRFIGRDTGIPGPGETLRIVAINRTTGYTGSATFTLGSPSTGDNVLYSGSINQRVPELTLTPPNLKVWARRIYDIEHGLTQGEKAEYLIGHEGAATRNDTLVAIFTEWLDEYGKPLPEGLGENSGKDFGLSGRLAKLTGNELTPISAGTAVDPDNFDLESAAQGSAVVEFGIKPGRQAQLIRLKSDHVSNEHYYVNVFGRAINKEACPHCEYDQTGKNEGILAQRPNHYTPFYVPRYDEETTLALRKEREEQRRAEAEEQAESGTTPTDEDELGKVEPQYAWMLRPEYQFSLIELTMNELQAVRYELDENGNEIEVTRNLLDAEQPVITSSDDLIRVLTDLLLPAGDPLEGFDGPTRQYVLALGEDELLLEFDSNGQLQVVNAQGEQAEGLELTNLEHLSSLNVEDFLTIRLYLNGDPENYLWQWAFGAQIEGGHNVKVISADDVEGIELTAYLPVQIDVQNLRNITVQWAVDNGGVLSKSISSSEYGIFKTTLRPSTVAGTIHNIEVEVVDSDDDRVLVGTKKQFEPIEITPGASAKVLLVTDESSVLNSGVDTTDLVGTVLDKYDNPVTEGTAVIWSSGYSGQLRSSVETVDHNGIVTSKYQSGLEEVGTEVLLEVGGQADSTLITKDILDYTLSVSQLSFNPGETGTVTLSMSHETAEPIPVFWGNSHGAISGPESVSGGFVEAVFSIGELMASEGYVTVSVGGVQKRISYSVIVPHTPGSISFDHASIASGSASSYAVETLSGTTSQSVVNATAATVYGVPGQTVTISAGGFYSQNFQPVAIFPMAGLDRNMDDESIVIDTVGGIEALIQGDVRRDEGNSYAKPGSSLRFEGGRLVAQDPENLRYNTDYYLNVRFYPSQLSDGAILVKKGGNDGSGYQISLVEIDGQYYLQAKASTDEGVFTVTSEQSIELETWYLAGLQVKSGLLTVGLNESRNSVPLTGIPRNSGFASNLVIGEGFSGSIGEVKLGQIDEARGLLALIDGVAEKEITFDENGEARINISGGSANLDVLGARVGFSIVGAQRVTYREENELRYHSPGGSAAMWHHFLPSAYASEHSPRMVDDLEGGVAVVDGQAMAEAIDMLKRAGEPALEAITMATKFLFEMTGISDVWQLTRAVYLWMNGRFDDVDKIELAFAGIGLTLTIVTVAVSVGTVGAGAPASIAAMVSVRGALRVLKSTLKEVFQQEPAQIVRIGGTVARWSFDLVGKLLSGSEGREAAIKQLVDFKDAFIDLIEGGTTLVWGAFKSVGKSANGIVAFINLSKLKRMPCAIAYNNPYPVLQSAYATPLCGVVLYEKILKTADDLGMTDVERMYYFNAVNKLSGTSEVVGAAVVRFSSETAEHLGRMVKAGQGGSINRFVENIRSGDASMKGFTAEKLGAEVAPGGGTAFDVLMDAISHIPTADPSAYEKAFNQLATRNASNIRGIYGEAATFKRLKSENISPESSLRANPESLQVGRDVEFSGPGQQGVDIEGVLEADELVSRSLRVKTAEGRPLFIEVKNYTHNYPTGKMVAQTNKHIDANIIPEIDLDNFGSDGYLRWARGQPPHLHYELMGEGFVNPATGGIREKLVRARIDAIVKLCMEKMSAYPLSFVRPKFDCEKDITFKIIDSLIFPLTARLE